MFYSVLVKYKYGLPNLKYLYSLMINENFCFHLFVKNAKIFQNIWKLKSRKCHKNIIHIAQSNI